MKRNIPILRFKDKNGKDFPNWQEKKLGEIADIYNGSTPLKTNIDFWENGNIPWFTIADIKKQGRIIYDTIQKITEKALKNTSIKILPVNSILLCCTASIGEYAINKIPLTTNQQFNGLIIKSNKILNNYFLFHFCYTLKNKLIKLSGITSINFLSINELSKISIPLPCIEEQSKIASFLSSIDKKLEIIKTRKELFIKFKNTLLSLTFPKKNSTLPLLRFKDKNGKDFPNWQEKKLGDVITKTIDNRGKTPPTVNNGISLIEVNAISDNFKYPLYKNIKKYISQETYDTWFRDYIKKDDILISTVGRIGSVAIYDNKLKSNVAQNIIGLRINQKNNNSDFLYYSISNLKFKKQVIAITMQCAQPSLKVPELLTILIPLPCIEEQSKIASFLSSIDKKIEILEKTYNEFSNFKKFAMQNLFPKV